MTPPVVTEPLCIFAKCGQPATHFLLKNGLEVPLCVMHSHVLRGSQGLIVPADQRPSVRVDELTRGVRRMLGIGTRGSAQPSGAKV